MTCKEISPSSVTIYSRLFSRLDERVLRFFHSPQQAFLRLKQHPSWVVPLLIVMGASIPVILLHHAVVPRQARIEAQMAELEKYRGQVFGEEERMAWVRSQTAYENIKTIGVAAISFVIVALVSALAFWVAFSLAGHDFRFKTVFSVFNHALLPPSIAWSFLTSLVLCFKDPIQIDPIRPENVVLSNPAAFLDQATIHPFFYSLLSSLDLFSIWTLVLLSIGFSVCGTKLRLGKSALVTTCVWSIYVIGKASIASFFSR